MFLMINLKGWGVIVEPASHHTVPATNEDN